MPKLSSSAQKLPPFDLAAEREKHKMTQHECADFFFTSQSSIARWETDGTLPQIFREYWALYWRVNRKPKTTKKPT